MKGEPDLERLVRLKDLFDSTMLGKRYGRLPRTVRGWWYRYRGEFPEPLTLNGVHVWVVQDVDEWRERRKGELEDDD